ncbi:MAG: coiled-coil domain-containing protein, partial [Planctomycetota bacterium]
MGADKPSEAIEKFSEAVAFTDDPGSVESRISEIRSVEYERHMETCRQSLEESDLETARAELDAAREWGLGREEELGAVASEIEAELEARDRAEKYGAMENEATSLLENGDRRGALSILLEASSAAPDTQAHESRIEVLKSDGKVEQLRASEALEAEEKLDEALIEARSALFWAGEEDEEVRARVSSLEASIRDRERDQARRGFEEAGEGKIAAGEIMAGLELLREAIPLAKDPGNASKALDARVDDEVNRRLTDAETRAQEGEFDEAMTLLTQAAAWNPDRSAEVEAKRTQLEERRERYAREAEFKRHKAEAEKRYSGGDVRGAFEALRIARSLTDDADSLDRRVDEMKKSTYDNYMSRAEERQAAGDLEGALEACELAREWAGDGIEGLDKRVKAIRERVGQQKLEQEFRAKEEEAEGLLARGYARLAVERLQEALATAPSRPAVENRIAEIVESTFKRHIKEADRAAVEGDLITAFDWLDRAREWSEGREEELETKVNRLKDEESAKERRDEHNRLVVAADAELEGGRMKEGVELLRRAKTLSDDPDALEERIQAVRRRTFDELALQAVMQEESQDYEGAILSWSDALQWTKSPEKTAEVEGFIQRLEEAVSEEGPEEVLQRVGTLVQGLLEQGDIPGALRRYHVASRFVDSPDEARKQVYGIATQAIKARVEEGREAVEEGDWERALEAVRSGIEVKEAVKSPDSAVEAAAAELTEIRVKGDYLRLQAEANVKATKGDVKGAIEACQRAMDLTEEKEAIQTVMVSLVEAALKRWISEAETLEQTGDWIEAAKVLSGAIDLFSLDESAVEPIRDRRPDVESRLKNVQYKRYIMAAASEEAQGNLLNAIEHLRHAGEFSGKPQEIEGEIARLQGLLFEQFHTDLTRVESEEGVEGAIRFCKAALDYFPDATVVKRKLRELEEQWKTSEKEGASDEHLAFAEALEGEGKLQDAFKAYRAASETASDPAPILDSMDRVVDALIGSTLNEVRSLVSRKRFGEARRLLELPAQEYPESRLIRNELKAISDAETSTGEGDRAQGPLTTAMWDDVEPGGEEAKEEGEEEAVESSGILTSIWETGEFSAEDLFKDMDPVDVGEDEGPQTQDGIKPLALDLSAPDEPTEAPVEDDDILEPLAGDVQDEPAGDPVGTAPIPEPGPEPEMPPTPEEETAKEQTQPEVESALPDAEAAEPELASPEVEDAPADAEVPAQETALPEGEPEAPALAESAEAPPEKGEQIRTVMEKILKSKKKIKRIKKKKPEEAAVEAAVSTPPVDPLPEEEVLEPALAQEASGEEGPSVSEDLPTEDPVTQGPDLAETAEEAATALGAT